jgi:hypothetical protein
MVQVHDTEMPLFDYCVDVHYMLPFFFLGPSQRTDTQHYAQTAVPNGDLGSAHPIIFCLVLSRLGCIWGWVQLQKKMAHVITTGCVKTTSKQTCPGSSLAETGASQ